MPAGLEVSQILILRALALVKLLLGAGIAGLAFVGYRSNGSRPMLFLAAGIGAITLFSTAAMIVTREFYLGWAGPIVGEVVSLVGFLLILYSIVLARGS